MKRHKTMVVDADLLVSVVKAGATFPGARVSSNGLPEDAKIVAASVTDDGRHVKFVIESEEYSDIDILNLKEPPTMTPPMVALVPTAMVLAGGPEPHHE